MKKAHATAYKQYIQCSKNWINQWMTSPAWEWMDRAGDLYKRLKVYLRILDRSPDDLAAFLGAQGCAGRRGDPSSCPVAVYLRRTPALRTASVHTDYLIVRGQATPIPDRISDFVRRFDAGHYPALEA